jgi:hypothetical protein
MIEVEQGAGAVVAADELGIGQALDYHGLQALVDLGQHRFELAHVEARGRGCIDTESAARDPPPEARRWT